MKRITEIALIIFVMTTTCVVADDSLNVHCIAAYDHFGSYWVKPLSITGNSEYPDTMYMCGTRSLQVLDVRNPLDILSLGELSASELGVGCDVIYGNGVLFYKSSEVLYTLDVSSSLIVKMDSINIWGVQLELSNNHIFIPGVSSGYSIIDVSNPDSLFLVYRDTSREVTSLAVEDTILYLVVPTDLRSGKVIRFDISDITAPSLIDSIILASPTDWVIPYEIVLDEHYAYVITVGAYNYLYVLQLEPVLDSISDYLICNQQFSIKSMIHDGLLFVFREGNSFDSGVEIIDILNPFYPTHRGYYRKYTTFIALRNGVLKDSLLYFADYDNLKVLDVSDALLLPISEIPSPENFALSASPNPFNSSVRIAVEGECDSPMQIEIYDVAGRLIAEITPPAPLDRGEYGKSPLSKGDLGGLFVWQPSPSLPSGVYLVRARFDRLSDRGEESITKRIVYLK